MTIHSVFLLRRRLDACLQMGRRYDVRLLTILIAAGLLFWAASIALSQETPFTPELQPAPSPPLSVHEEPGPLSPAPTPHNAADPSASPCDNNCDCDSCGRSSACHDWCCSPCNMYQHTPYYPEMHGYYYFRPYNYTHIGPQRRMAMSWGGDPRSPYGDDTFQRVYASMGLQTKSAPKPAAPRTPAAFGPTITPPPPTPLSPEPAPERLPELK